MRNGRRAWLPPSPRAPPPDALREPVDLHVGVLLRDGAAGEPEDGAFVAASQAGHAPGQLVGARLDAAAAERRGEVAAGGDAAVLLVVRRDGLHDG